MPRKKKIEPLTWKELVEILGFVFEPESEVGAVYNSYQEDTELRGYIDSAVKQINDHFNPPTQA